MSRKVTEQDFRRPEFVGKDPEDYEFRADGVIVRKDRWETGIGSIVHALGMNRNEFEISDVVNEVRKRNNSLHVMQKALEEIIEKYESGFNPDGIYLIARQALDKE